jgi:replicative DNA helicase
MDIVRDDIDFSVYENRDEWHKVRPASSWLDEMLERMAHPEEHLGDALPWSKIDGYRMRKSEVTVWAGVNGHGKSMVLSHVMLHAMSIGKKVVICSMEMTPVKTMERMVRQASCGGNPSPRYVREFNGWTGIAMETGVHIHLVAHARKGEKETDRLDKFDIKGTSEITDQVDNVILIQRNKRKEADRDGKLADEPDAYLTIAKQRHGDWEGTAGLWYDHPSQSYLPFASASPIGIDL